MTLRDSGLMAPPTRPAGMIVICSAGQVADAGHRT